MRRPPPFHSATASPPVERLQRRPRRDPRLRGLDDRVDPLRRRRRGEPRLDQVERVTRGERGARAARGRTCTPHAHAPEGAGCGGAGSTRESPVSRFEFSIRLGAHPMAGICEQATHACETCVRNAVRCRHEMRAIPASSERVDRLGLESRGGYTVERQPPTRAGRDPTGSRREGDAGDLASARPIRRRRSGTTPTCRSCRSAAI